MRIQNGYRCWKVIIKGTPATGWARKFGETFTMHIITEHMPSEDTIREVIEETPALHGFDVSSIQSVEDVWVPTCVELEAEPERQEFELIEDAKEGDKLFFDSNGKCYIVKDDE